MALRAPSHRRDRRRRFRCPACPRRSTGSGSASSPTSITARWCRPSDVMHAVQLVNGANPDLIVLGGDYVTFGDRAFVGPVAELLAPLQRAARRLRDPRQPRRRSRHAGGADASAHPGVARRADEARHPRRPHRARRCPLLDAASRRCRSRAAACRDTRAPARARSAAPQRSRGARTCRRCCRATRTAVRSCCLESARWPAAASRSSPAWRAGRTRRSS